MINTATTIEQLTDLLQHAQVQFSEITPSQWAEKNRILTTEETPFPGPFSFNRTPYTREILDCFSPSHPAKIVAIMKGAQIGITRGFVENALGYIIQEAPGPTLFMTGHDFLAKKSMEALDTMIINSGLGDYIKANTLTKGGRTGNTIRTKEFSGGKIISGTVTNHKLLRQISARYGFIDDIDAAKAADQSSGDTLDMFLQRFNFYSEIMKVAFLSSPELEETSVIEPAFLRGDQRYFNLPCPCCGTYINLEWIVEIPNTDGKEKAGIHFKVDSHGRLIESSVGYICQSCGEFFDERNKASLLLDGKWIPTATPEQPDIYSYHINTLYAPPGATNWTKLCYQWLAAHPQGEERIEAKYQAFQNLVLGKTYKQKAQAPKANALQQNVRPYQIPTIPTQLTQADGNGQVVLLTCAADLNGTMEDINGTIDDVRLDWEITAHTSSGATYSIDQGSIGTFKPRQTALQKENKTEPRYTYHRNQPNSVWPIFEEIISKEYYDELGNPFKIFITGIDCGHFTQLAYKFLDTTHVQNVVGLRGDIKDKFISFTIDKPLITPSRARPNLYNVEVNLVKDYLADCMSLKWLDGEAQPSGFMNFPQPEQGKYLFPTYFEHFEAEHRVIETKDGKGVAAQWQKKNSAVQNHFWDVRVYNIALRHVFMLQFAKQVKAQNLTWAQTVNLITGT